MKEENAIKSEYTDYGFEEVSPNEKRRRVSNLFDSVASNYDLMNDLMSFGVHRLWKQYAVHLANLKPGDQVLDIAGGTGDMAGLIARRVGKSGGITICDISQEMINEGKSRLLNKGIQNKIRFVQGDAENLPFNNNSFDFVCISFGLRNITDKSKALRSMFLKLKYGSPILILEFSKVVIPQLQSIYNKYSDFYIPLLGKYIAGDEKSYRYLIESIRMHPDQITLTRMLKQAGFSRVQCLNLSGGIVAIHKAYKI